MAAVVLGRDLALEDRILATAALSAMQGVIAQHGDEDPEVLRQVLVPAVLRPARAGLKTRARPAP
ncbi:hypothetical protein [Streptomyces wuyuanensis]|uniref:hypothetical protein n=1 Tax=Streptomyces wuyuanensis TaxID=1196353 RepID=UPI003718DB16